MVTENMSNHTCTPTDQPGFLQVSVSHAPDDADSPSHGQTPKSHGKPNATDTCA